MQKNNHSKKSCCIFAELKTKEFINLLKTIKEMKKVLFVLAIAGFFAACGGNKNSETATETPAEETQVEETVETATETPAETPVQ